MIGVVNLDKPVGPTSHDMVGLLRRLTGLRRIGHAGTLDPLASGVLPVLIGAATRFSEELTGGHKRYAATIRLGRTSATDDAEGPIADGAPPPGEVAIRAALLVFVGPIDQQPPAFSARRLNGRRAYRAARAGEPLELPPRRVWIDAIEVLEISDGDGTRDVRIDLRCGPGTYVRSLARDLGARLGCGGYLAALRRTQAAGLSVADAATPEALAHLAAEGRLATAVLPVGGLLSLPPQVLEPDAARRFTNGATLQVADAAGADARRVVYCGDVLLGVGRVSAGVLHPEKVLPEADR